MHTFFRAPFLNTNRDLMAWEPAPLSSPSLPADMLRARLLSHHNVAEPPPTPRRRPPPDDAPPTADGGAADGGAGAVHGGAGAARLRGQSPQPARAAPARPPRTPASDAPGSGAGGSAPARLASGAGDHDAAAAPRRHSMPHGPEAADAGCGLVGGARRAAIGALVAGTTTAFRAQPDAPVTSAAHWRPAPVAAVAAADDAARGGGLPVGGGHGAGSPGAEGGSCSLSAAASRRIDARS